MINHFLFHKSFQAPIRFKLLSPSQDDANT